MTDPSGPPISCRTGLLLIGATRNKSKQETGCFSKQNSQSALQICITHGCPCYGASRSARNTTFLQHYSGEAFASLRRNIGTFTVKPPLLCPVYIPDVPVLACILMLFNSFCPALDSTAGLQIGEFPNNPELTQAWNWFSVLHLPPPFGHFTNLTKFVPSLVLSTRSVF